MTLKAGGNIWDTFNCDLNDVFSNEEGKYVGYLSDLGGNESFKGRLEASILSDSLYLFGQGNVFIR